VACKFFTLPDELQSAGKTARAWLLPSSPWVLGSRCSTGPGQCGKVHGKSSSGVAVCIPGLAEAGFIFAQSQAACGCRFLVTFFFLNQPSYHARRTSAETYRVVTEFRPPWWLLGCRWRLRPAPSSRWHLSCSRSSQGADHIESHYVGSQASAAWNRQVQQALAVLGSESMSPISVALASDIDIRHGAHEWSVHGSLRSESGSAPKT